MTAIKIPVYKPRLNGKEKEYVNECLDTSWISSRGKFITAFEEGFAFYTGTKKAVAVSNGTVALHLALLALDIKEGDEVIVPTFTYIATVNAVKYVQAIPVFADCDRATWQIDCDDI
jgi:perosamine synthetase